MTKEDKLFIWQIFVFCFFSITFLSGSIPLLLNENQKKAEFEKPFPKQYVVLEKYPTVGNERIGKRSYPIETFTLVVKGKTDGIIFDTRVSASQFFLAEVGKEITLNNYSRYEIPFWFFPLLVVSIIAGASSDAIIAAIILTFLCFVFCWLCEKSYKNYFRKIE